MSDNGCHHVRTDLVREGNDRVSRCMASGCNAETGREVDYYAENDDDDD